MVVPFFNVYLIERGLSATMLGTLLSVGALLALLLTPLLNGLADRRGIHRRLYTTYLLAFAFANLLFMIGHSTLVLGLALLLVQVTTGPANTLGMQLTMTKLQQQGRASFGRIKSFSALGFGAASLVAGWFFSLGGYTLIFGAGGLLAGLSAQLASILPARTVNQARPAKLEPRRTGFYVLVVTQFFCMMGLRAGFDFLFVHFNQDLHIPMNQIGLWAALLAGIETPFFVLLDQLLKRFDARLLLVVGGVGMGFVLIGFGLVPDTGWLLVMMVMRGFFWPLYFLPIFIVVSQASNPHNAATNQAIIQVTVPGVAALLTGSLAGWVFDNLGATALYTAAGTVCFIGASISILFFRTLRRKE
jgi:PPP family 3-phenylpropionic acid transporter